MEDTILSRERRSYQNIVSPLCHFGCVVASEMVTRRAAEALAESPRLWDRSSEGQQRCMVVNDTTRDGDLRFAFDPSGGPPARCEMTGVLSAPLPLLAHRRTRKTKS
eukprot:8676941-Pyramimonas_sp.AAC.1